MHAVGEFSTLLEFSHGSVVIFYTVVVAGGAAAVVGGGFVVVVPERMSYRTLGEWLVERGRRWQLQ